LRYIIHMMLNRPFQALRVFGREILRTAAIAALLLAAVRVHAQATWSPIVKVGPGYVDCFARQVVRTSSDVVYVITNASGFSGGTLPSSIRVYKGSPAGNPTTFAEVDAAHRPSNAVRMGGVEAKLAGTDRFIQIVYEDISASQTKYVKFDTLTDTWGTPEVVGALNGQNTLERYFSKTGLVLDSNGIPHVITGGKNESMYYTNRVNGTWSAPVAVANSSSQMHPSMSFDRNGTLHVAYYDGASSMFYRNRNAASGTWSAVETITSNVSTSQSDESPSLVIDSSGRVVVNYIAGDFSFHFKLARRTAANTWADISPGAEVAGHGPGLYIDAADNLYALEGHDLSIIQPSVEIRSAAGTWGSYSILATGPPTRDGSNSARWDLLFPGNATHLDTANMDEAGTDQFGNTYGITYYLHASLGITPPPPPADFSLTLPSGSAVSINAGQSTTIGVNIAASNGFNQTVTLSCSGAPAGATCGVSPGSVNPNGGNVSAQISITSTARSTAAIPHSVHPGSWLWIGAMVGCFLVIRRIAGARISSLKLRNDFCLAILVFTVSCGGGGGAVPGPTPTPPSTGGTPAGTYSLTVTGTSGAQTRSTTINLTVH
jgi:hypothetical protein